MKRIFTMLIAVVLCAAICFSGCEKKDAQLSEGIVATMKNGEISQEEYNFVYKMMYDNLAQYAVYYGESWYDMEIEAGKTIGDFIKESVAMQLEQYEAAKILAAGKLNIKIDDSMKKEAEATKESFIQQVCVDKTYEQFIEEARSSLEVADEYFLNMTIYNKISEELTKEGGEAYPSDDEALKSFKKERMRVQHILVSTQQKTDPETGNAIDARSDEDAQKIVKEIIAKLDEGADFDALIEEYNEDPGLTKGNYYVFGEGEMVAEFEEASKNLKVGEYTKEAVKTSYGYHIIKKYDLTADLAEFADFKETKAQENLKEILDKALKDVDFKWNDDKLGEYIDEWVTTMQEQSSAQQEAPQPTDEELKAMEAVGTEEDNGAQTSMSREDALKAQDVTANQKNQDTAKAESK